MRKYYIVSLILISIFFSSSLLLPQEKTSPPVNDIKFFNGQWYFENFNNVNGYNHPNGKSPFVPTDEFSTATFSSSDTVVIPNLVSTISDSILVTGLDTWLYDLNLQTFITHSYCADLNITLRSPSGKVVTVSTDNAADNSNVFDGTIWDDQANPGGQVPYSDNSGLVTDHLYVNQTTATPLVPEESFGLFMGENPNGWWLLTISDDEDEDGGSINGWSIEITTSSIVPTTLTDIFVSNVELLIPTVIAVDSVMINVTGLGNYLLDVDLTTWLRHTYAADLDITLKSPAGTIVTLTSDNGSGNDDVFNGTFWDDNANPGGQVPYTNNNGLVADHSYTNLVTATPLAPEESFAAFLGEDPNGIWVLTISDDGGGDGGALDSFYLHITTSPDILPVELASFNYQILDNGVNLNWTTSSEMNNKGFEIQRTKGNGNWIVIGFAEGQGTTTRTSLYSFIDRDLLNNTTYSYRLKQIDFDGTIKYSNTIEVNFHTVTSFDLLQNFPNPFNPSTKITFILPEAGIVKLTIHNIIGEVISTLVNKRMEEGIHSVVFDASSLPSGIYIYQIEVNDFVSTKKMILIK